MLQVACSCFAVLPKCGGDSDTGSDKQSASWEIQFKKLLSNLYYYVNELLGDYALHNTYSMCLLICCSYI